jgi:hypothetical protein
MKLNKDVLKSLIVEVLQENDLVLEAPEQSKYDRVMSRLRDADYGSIAMMSGQYPMGKSSDLAPKVLKQFNARMKKDLEQKVTEMGLEFERIGGSFGPNIEQSVMIWDPNQLGSISEGEHMRFLEKIEILNREHTQWGFVGGKRITAGADGNADYIFTMYKIDYNNKMGFYQDPDSEETTTIEDNEDIKDRESGFSFIPASGPEVKPGAKRIGKKFGMTFPEKERGDQ